VTQLGEVSALTKNIVNNVNNVIVGKAKAIELSIIALLSEGHLLIEDVPGLGKTTLAKAIANSTGCTFKRIQFVPDLLPSDITGLNIFNQKTGEFEFKAGPIMSQFVLADEINRAPSKSQSALLESMEERQATVDGVTYQLPRPFFIIATLNPAEYHGIFPLPEAQLDRFIMKVSLGYATFEEEMAIINRQENHNPVDQIESVITPEELLRCQEACRTVYVDQLVREYIVSITQATRNHQSLTLGVSHRGSLALFRTSQALALMRGREFVVPDDVKELSEHVLAHRLILTPEARAQGLDGKKLITGIIDNIAIPGVPI